VTGLEPHASSPGPWGELEGTARLYAQHEQRAAARWKREFTATREGAIKRNRRTSLCSCNGASNRHQHGSRCKDWERDGSAPWCYVSWACDRGTPASKMATVKWVTCESKRMWNRDLRAALDSHPKKKKLPHNECSCSGTKNAAGRGGSCKMWLGYGQPWCYVGITCAAAYASSELANTKWLAKCNDAHQHESHSSPYRATRQEVGEQAGLERTGQGITRAGWSWGVTVPDDSRYPECVQKCQMNSACMGVTYAANTVPSQNPAAPPIFANTCHQFTAITQQNSDQYWLTWLK